MNESNKKYIHSQRGVPYSKDWSIKARQIDKTQKVRDRDDAMGNRARWTNSLADIESEDDTMHQFEMKDMIEDLLRLPKRVSGLMDREKWVLRACFGIGCQKMSLDEIAEYLNLGRDRVRQLREHAINKLREALKKGNIDLYENKVRNGDNVIVEKVIHRHYSDDEYKDMMKDFLRLPKKISGLSDQEKHVLKSTWGIGCKEMDRDEIAKELNISPEKVTGLREKGAAKFKNAGSKGIIGPRKNKVDDNVSTVIENVIKRYLSENLALNEAQDDTFSFDDLNNIRSFAKRVEYCKMHLGNPIGRGSSRVVFQLDDEKVLKLAMNRKGVAQNNVEYDKYAETYNVTPKLYNCANDETWIVTEYVLPAKRQDFMECLGIDFDTFFEFIKACYNCYARRGREVPCDLSNEQFSGLCDNNEDLYHFYCYMADYQLPFGDICRLGNLGMVMRDGEPHIVILDTGCNQEVYDTYYNRG